MLTRSWFVLCVAALLLSACQATATPSPAPVPPAPQTVQVFLIALEDNGQGGQPVGCGDSAIPVSVEVPATDNPLRAAFDYLLSLREPYYGQSGLYNVLYESTLQVDSAAIEDGTAVVHLSGALMLRGVCDNPRAQAQLELTARQFPDVQAVSVFINGVPLADVLSQQ